MNSSPDQATFHRRMTLICGIVAIMCFFLRLIFHYLPAGDGIRVDPNTVLLRCAIVGGILAIALVLRVRSSPIASTRSTPLAVSSGEFVAILSDAGKNKIKVIKCVRSITGLGLVEAKRLVESAPVPIKSGISEEAVEQIQALLSVCGAKVDAKKVEGG